MSDQLQTLQDKVPAFSKDISLDEIRNGVGSENFKDFIDISEPIAAASIAQVHKAQIKENGVIKEVAIKVLRPNIKKVFNDEIEALMLFAYLIESLVIHFILLEEYRMGLLPSLMENGKISLSKLWNYL